MSSTLDLGIVTAYGYAKAGGFSGTQAQFQSMLAGVEYHRDLARSYARGDSGIRTGEATDNALYYMNQVRDATVDFTGATSSENGARGLVPAPTQSANPEKVVLRSDGQWGTIEAVPNGGTAGQILAKHSATDGDAEWIDNPVDPDGADSVAYFAEADGSAPSISDPYLRESDLDDALSALSTNPVKNSIIKAALDPLNALLTGTGIFGNAGYHNSLYRGKSLGSSVTSAQYDAIDAGTFDDLYIGDYWTIDGVNWVIVAFDYWYGGSIAYGGAVHHVVIMPDDILYIGKMNDTSITTGGYVGSKMYGDDSDHTNGNLSNAVAAIKSAFGVAHLLVHDGYFCNGVTDGKSSAEAVYSSIVELPNEIMVFGHYTYGGNYDGSTLIGISTCEGNQLPIMTLFPQFIYSKKHSYWLRDVAAETRFAFVDGANKRSFRGVASTETGVRPVFAICKANAS